MTTAEFIKKLDSKIALLQKGEALQRAVLAINTERTARIFERGLNTSGSKIGNYNATKPVYINPNDAPKGGNQVGKSGKKIKSLYYPSYKAFRSAMGRESNFVNVRLNNELQNDLGNGALSKGASGIVKPSPIKISNTKYRITLKKDINIKKVEGLEKKFGKFLDHTKQEKELFQKVYAFEVEKILK